MNDTTLPAITLLVTSAVGTALTIYEIFHCTSQCEKSLNSLALRDMSCYNHSQAVGFNCHKSLPPIGNQTCMNELSTAASYADGMVLSAVLTFLLSVSTISFATYLCACNNEPQTSGESATPYAQAAINGNYSSLSILPPNPEAANNV